MLFFHVREHLEWWAATLFFHLFTIFLKQIKISKMPKCFEHQDFSRMPKISGQKKELNICNLPRQTKSSTIAWNVWSKLEVFSLNLFKHQDFLVPNFLSTNAILTTYLICLKFLGSMKFPKVQDYFQVFWKTFLWDSPECPFSKKSEVSPSRPNFCPNMKNPSQGNSSK